MTDIGDLRLDPERVSDLGQDLLLVTDSQEIEHTLDNLGLTDEDNLVGAMFIDSADGDYTDVWFTKDTVVYDHSRAWPLVTDGQDHFEVD